jgi:hypothetical protein
MPKKIKPLFVSMPQPCDQKWDEMTDTASGKHCHQCNKVLFDFSQMTDSELLRFFAQVKEKPCGRFHRSQLNRPIAPVMPERNIFRRFHKMAATMLALFTLKNTPVKAQQNKVPVENVPVSYIDTVAALPAFPVTIADTGIVTPGMPVTIKGIVRTWGGEPIADAVVTFADSVTQTNAAGEFAFAARTIDEPHNIYFQPPGYSPVVRNYHPAMGSTIYEVVVYDGSVVALSGVPVFSFKDETAAEYFADFEKQQSVLSKDAKEQLRIIAAQKQDFNADVQLTANAKTAAFLKLTRARLKEIRKYLVEVCGLQPGSIHEKINRAENTDRIKIF